MRALLIVLGLGALAGCEKKKAETAPPVEHRTDAAEAARPAPDAGADPCVAKCVQDNQMRAVSIEQIEADCVRQCTPQ